MELEWDEKKREANLAKHGLDFADVVALDWGEAGIVEDARFPYPERRYRALLSRGEAHYVVAFCYRGAKLRVISFRRARVKEVKKYAQ